MIPTAIKRSASALVHRKTASERQDALWAALIDEARQSHLVTSLDHGEDHWRAVAATGLHIAATSILSRHISPSVMLAFGLLHDCRRHNDHDDPGHGPRAADMVSHSRTARALFTEGELILLAAACRGHTHERRSSNATIGACWDADRFNLTRFNFDLDMRFFSPHWRQDDFDEMCTYARRMQALRPDFQDMRSSLKFEQASLIFKASEKDPS